MRSLVLFLGGLAAVAAPAPPDEIPAWVREAAARPAPALSPRPPAVVLFQEEVLNVDSAGRRVIQERAVVRKLTPELRAKSAQLTAGATTPLAKIAAIAAFVQQTHYISVQMNLTRGGGYTPHRAADVLSKNYGDCKDKANLMKALLAAAGIDSHLVVIYSGALDFVRPEWPSTLQFNHMILAVRVPESVALPPVLHHPSLGRLLFFDPTDPYTALGDLPDDEQGSHALFVAATGGALVTVPRAPAAANRASSRTRAAIAADGNLTAFVAREYFGQTARDYRAMLARRDEDGVRRSFEFVLTRQIGGVSLQKLETKDDAAAGRLAIGLAFSAPQFGRTLQNRLLLFTPGALLSGGSYSFPEGERRHPVKLDAERREDHVAVELPPGFQVDELPDPVLIESELGVFRAHWKTSGATVELEQQLELRDSLTPAAN